MKIQARTEPSPRQATTSNTGKNSKAAEKPSATQAASEAATKQAEHVKSAAEVAKNTPHVESAQEISKKAHIKSMSDVSKQAQTANAKASDQNTADQQVKRLQSVDVTA